MPLAEWWLKPWNNQRDFVKVQIDPALISGHRGVLGPALFLPYTLSGQEEASATLLLLSLEGWMGWGNEAEYVAKLPIPSQIIWPGGQSRLQVPITDVQIEAIEQARNGGPVTLTVSLGGLAAAPLRLVSSETGGSAASTARLPSVEARPAPGDWLWISVMPVQNSYSVSFNIERERWLTVLQQLGAGTRRLMELPEPRLPRGALPWAECVRLLDGATQFYRSGEYEHALTNCRQIVEGIPQVLCAVWGLPQQREGQAFEGWTRELENRLSAAWPEDRLTPGMLRTMLAGAWHWLAPTPHYGTGIPLREDVAFALGLCTDLLLFAGQVLQTHSDPIAAVP